MKSLGHPEKILGLPDHAGLWGFARAVRMEYPGTLRIRCVDLDPSKARESMESPWFCGRFGRFQVFYGSFRVFYSLEFEALHLKSFLTGLCVVPAAASHVGQRRGDRATRGGEDGQAPWRLKLKNQARPA